MLILNLPRCYCTDLSGHQLPARTHFQYFESPPWIKLYNHLLDDFEFSCLPDASKAHLLSIWLLASRTNNRIPNNPQWISNKINATDKVNISLLVNSGFLSVIPSENNMLQITEQDASKVLQETEVDACAEREERESKVEQSYTPPAVAECPHQKIINLYHEILPANPKVKVWNDTRKGYLRSRWRELDDKNKPVPKRQAKPTTDSGVKVKPSKYTGPSILDMADSKRIS